MRGYQYICQNAVQNFLDHFIPIPDNFNVNPGYLYGLSCSEFIQGLRTLTGIISQMYGDMIINPSAYGFPLADYTEQNTAKIRDAKYSSHRLVTLLHTFVNNGVYSNEKITVASKIFLDACKQLKSAYKITNIGKILSKMCDFGFTVDGFNGKNLDKKKTEFVLYHKDRNVIAALYGYMLNKPLSESMFSINYHIVLPSADLSDSFCHKIFAEYLSGDERDFYIHFYESLKDNEAIIYEFNGFSVYYRLNLKSRRYVAQCYSANGKLRIDLILRLINHYSGKVVDYPETIKTLFRKKSDCFSCNESCKNKLIRVFEGEEYIDCGCKCNFAINSYQADDIEFYRRIILLEADAAINKSKN